MSAWKKCVLGWLIGTGLAIIMRIAFLPRVSYEYRPLQDVIEIVVIAGLLVWGFAERDA